MRNITNKHSRTQIKPSRAVLILWDDGADVGFGEHWAGELIARENPEDDEANGISDLGGSGRVPVFVGDR